jgi:hypothetical protein
MSATGIFLTARVSLRIVFVQTYLNQGIKLANMTESTRLFKTIYLRRSRTRGLRYTSPVGLHHFRIIIDTDWQLHLSHLHKQTTKIWPAIEKGPVWNGSPRTHGPRGAEDSRPSQLLSSPRPRLEYTKMT